MTKYFHACKRHQFLTIQNTIKFVEMKSNAKRDCKKSHACKRMKCSTPCNELAIAKNTITHEKA